MSRALQRIEAKPGWIKFAVGFIPILIIGLLNFHSSSQISSSLFYLLPILFVTHLLGRRAGVAASMIATSLWFIADVTPPTPYQNSVVPFWNALMRLGVFLIVVWLMSEMRALMNTLERRVEERTDQLRQESAERRELERRILDISEREQARMGQDLHDGLCQHLVGMAFSANLLQQKLSGKHLAEAVDAARIATLLDESITQARRLARGLYPVRIEELGLATGLEELVLTMQEMFHVACEFKTLGNPVDLDQDASVALYRIAQEAVTNAVKHAKPRWIRVLLRSSPHEVELRVEDDGAGMTEHAARSSGLGLRIMEFRARTIGGEFRITPRREGGTVVSCLLPIPSTSEPS